MERTRERGWKIPSVGISDAFLDPLDPDSEHVNVLTSHGKLMLEQTRAFAETYITYDTRAAQDTHVMHRYIMNNMSKSAIKRLIMWKEECAVSN